MKKLLAVTVALASLLFITAAGKTTYAMPAITGTPELDSPRLLDWGRDVDNGTPDLTEQTANRLSDLHGSFSDCDIVLSTAGNYHMALRDLWYDVYLPTYASSLGLRNWFFTTSPPITMEQVKNANLVVGNLALKCVPQLTVGPLKAINEMAAAGLTEGPAIPVFKNRGNVLLVKKGNPKHIHSVWDLARPHVKVVTPNPNSEKNTFDNYVGTIYNVALNDQANAPEGWTADRLFNAIFNGTMGRGDDDKETMHKWIIGGRIHHREVPWSIAYGDADAGVIFYHLALDAVTRFPDLFEIVPLGGTVADPQPVPGNQVGAHYLIRIKGNWSDKQINARERLIDSFNSPEFTAILERHGLKR